MAGHSLVTFGKSSRGWTQSRGKLEQPGWPGLITAKPLGPLTPEVGLGECSRSPSLKLGLCHLQPEYGRDEACRSGPKGDRG